MQITAVGVAVGVALGVTMAMCNWWTELTILTEEWRCALETFGGLFVTMPGTTEMPEWFVLNLDTHHKVSVIVCSDKTKVSCVGYNRTCVMAGA